MPRASIRRRRSGPTWLQFLAAQAAGILAVDFLHVNAVFQATGTRILRSAVQAPRMNATCERLVGTLRREVLDRVLILGERHLRAVLTEYQAHYNRARPHQGIAQRVPDGEPGAPRSTVTDVDTRQIRRKPVLGGLINEYSTPPDPGRPAGHLPNPIFERDKIAQPPTRFVFPGAGIRLGLPSHPASRRRSCLRLGVSLRYSALMGG